MASNATENGGSDAEQSEINDTQVVDSPQVSEAVESLSTFTEPHGEITLKVIPSVTRGGTEWKISVYSSGIQGPLLETNQPLTDAQSSELGISRQLQDRLNDALEYAQANMELPRELGHMTRSKRSLSDLEALMD